jgi:hypothetical protein
MGREQGVQEARRVGVGKARAHEATEERFGRGAISGQA